MQDQRKFPFNTIYLNFNRIDMKRQIQKLKRIVTHDSHSKFVNRASSKRKPIRRIKPKIKIPSAHTHISHPPHISSQQLNTSKSQPETLQLSPNTPFNFPLDDYTHDILSHITSLDHHYHLHLLHGLQNAQHIQITAEMRGILIGWLVKVARKFKVKSETLHMCVQLIDYMLIFKGDIFHKKNFQLLGVASLFTACKYNEIYTVEAEKYVDFCDGQYKLSDLFEMEAIILSAVSFNLQIPTIHQYIGKIVEDYELCEEQQGSIKMLSDMLMYDFNVFNSFEKVYLATAMVSVTGKIEKISKNFEELEKGLKESTLKKCKMAIISMYKKNALLKQSSPAYNVSI